MAKTVVGYFDNFTQAEQAVRALTDNGFDRNDISLIASDAPGVYTRHDDATQTITETGASGVAMGAGTGAVVGGLGGLLVGLGALAIPGIGPVIAAGPLGAALLGAGLGGAAGGIIGALTDIGVAEEEAGVYAEGIRRGGAVVSLKTEGLMADRAADILERHGAVDIDKQAAEWRQSGWTGYDPHAESYRKAESTLSSGKSASTMASTTTSDRMTTATASITPPSPDAMGTTATKPLREPPRQRTATENVSTHQGRTGETTIPVVEEELHVGKRAVERGGVRVYSRVTETPREETVQLRDEEISVERRPVNRPLRSGEMAELKDTVVEMRETDEEAVITKEARVVEEVDVRKNVTERTETVRDTVRRTDVNVEQIGAHRASSTRGFDSYATDFRNNFASTYGNRGYAYDRYEPAYRYGYTLASDTRYSGKNWNAIEADVRRDWEKNNQGQGAWEDFKDSIRYAWDKVRGHGSASRAA